MKAVTFAKGIEPDEPALWQQIWNHADINFAVWVLTVKGLNTGELLKPELIQFVSDSLWMVICSHNRTSMAQTPLGPGKYVRDKGSLS